MVAAGLPFHENAVAPGVCPKDSAGWASVVRLTSSPASTRTKSGDFKQAALSRGEDEVEPFALPNIRAPKRGKCPTFDGQSRILRPGFMTTARAPTAVSTTDDEIVRPPSVVGHRSVGSTSVSEGSIG